jgi:hypothetical protein
MATVQAAGPKLESGGKTIGGMPSSIFGWTKRRQNHNLKPVARAMFPE